MDREALEASCQRLIPELFSFVSVGAEDIKRGAAILWQSLEGTLVAGGEALWKTNPGVGLKMAAFRQLYLLLEREEGGPHSQTSPLSALALPERAALYLRHRTAFSLEEMGDILGQDRPGLFSLLHSAQEKMGLSPHPSLGEAHCLHHRQVSALVDSDAREGPHGFLRHHLRACPPCRNFYNRCVLSQENVAAQVPKNPIPRHLQHQWEESLPPLLNHILPKEMPSRPPPGQLLGDFFRALFGPWALGAILLLSLLVLGLGIVG